MIVSGVGRSIRYRCLLSRSSIVRMENGSDIKGCLFDDVLGKVYCRKSTAELAFAQRCADSCRFRRGERRSFCGHHLRVYYKVTQRLRPCPQSIKVRVDLQCDGEQKAYSYTLSRLCMSCLDHWHTAMLGVVTIRHVHSKTMAL